MSYSLYRLLPFSVKNKMTRGEMHEFIYLELVEEKIEIM